MRSELSRALGCALGVSLVVVSQRAEAADGDACANLSDENNSIPAIYIENGDTQEPVVKKIGKLLMQSSTKLRVFYRNRPTCNIRSDLFSNAVMTTVVDGATPRPVRYIPSSATFDPSGPAPTCTVPAAGDPSAVPIALGIGATYLSSCAPTPAQPNDIGVFEGPVQAYGFITNKNSSQVAITAEEGYLAYGFTEGGGEAAPWTVQNLRFKRGNTASTTLTMSSAIRLLPTQMQAAADSGTSEGLITSVMNATTPEAALGILGTELFDQRRADIKLLAFKTFGQKFAYFPDSTNATFDKQNVRDGHYLPWSPTPYIAKVTPGTKTITDANAKRIYELVMGTRVGDDVDGLLQVVQSGLVPECAMKVTRSGDGADLSLYDDPAPCGCYFEKNVPQGSTTCKQCTVGNDGPCNGGKCRFGFCEAK
ncbi:MAG: hypothetical protein KF795_11805 [Labilithrix sp.]|nr:hypothetical protein [Labilithrix sp.]